MVNPTRTKALLVADAPGHILEWRGKLWRRFQPSIQFELACSSVAHPFSCFAKGAALGLIHWIDPHRFYACARAATVPQVAMIHHILEEDVMPLARRLQYADAITTTSKRWQIKLQHMTDREVWIIPDTVDTATFQPPADKHALRKAAGIADSDFVIGFVGKALADVSGRKGTDLLVEVLTAVRQQWKNVCLLMVGPGWEKLAKQIESLGIRVLLREFPDTQSTVAAYSLMDVFMVTAKLEGGPCTILEAMASGVPVITSDVGHVPEVVTNGVTGFICRDRTVSEYMETLSSLRSDASVGSRISHAARNFVLKHREDSTTVPKIDFEEIYRHAKTYFGRRPVALRAVRRLPLAYFATHWVVSAPFRMIGIR
jgi:glycosyltransferase involved in cell wall biosynthesis